MRLEKVYDVPTWTDSDGAVWFKHISALSFVNKDTGWVVGSGQVSYTHDGGKTWINQFDEQMANGFALPQRVFAVDHLNVWLLMLSDRSSPKCFFTRDGGERWRVKSLPSLLHPNDIFFVDEKSGWIISDDGETPASNALIHTTLDRGYSWREHELEIKGRPARVRFLNPNKGLLLQVTTNDRKTTTISNILITDDGGHDWRVLKSFNRLITNMHIASDIHFWVIGEGGFIARTTTGGLTWNRCKTTTNQPLNTIAFDGDKKVIVGGDSGVLLVSKDGGQQWSNYTGPLELDHFVDACFLENNRAICATSTEAFLLAFS